MTTEDVLREIRVRLGDVDGILDEANVDYSDSYLLQHLMSAALHLEALSIVDTVYTVDTDISPEPSVIDGLLLASHSVMQLLGGDLSTKIRNGEYGIRFKSGQDEISTIEASKKIESLLALAKKDFRSYVIARIGDKSTSAVRLQ